jgi:restriction system protein
VPKRTRRGGVCYRNRLLPRVRPLYEEVVALINARREELEAELAATKRWALLSSHAEIDALRNGFESGSRDAVEDYFGLVLERSTYPNGFPQQAKVAYLLESKQLVAEYDFPPFEIVPAVAGYRPADRGE